jgi:hypothetical protein
VGAKFIKDEAGDIKVEERERDNREMEEIF